MSVGIKLVQLFGVKRAAYKVSKHVSAFSPHGSFTLRRLVYPQRPKSFMILATRLWFKGVEPGSSLSLSRNTLGTVAAVFLPEDLRDAHPKKRI